ncbi:MAG: hypothetical protein IPP76_14355 [Moraxellaceae bacterium]|nr:hypothetical protein [Moraxellaceae bacterium]
MNARYIKGLSITLCVAVSINVSAEEATSPIVNVNTEPTIAVDVTSPPRSSDCIQRDDEGHFLGWIDSQHCLVSYRATQTAQWLDSLFGQVENNQDSIGRIRIINDVTWLESSGLTDKIRIRASVKLPNAKRRFRLVISDEEDSLYANQQTTPTSKNNEKTSAAIRWLPNVVSRVKYSVDIGAHSTDVFTRFRAQRDWRISDNSIFRFNETLRYGLKTELKSVSQGEVERLLNDKTVLRLSTALQYWQNEPQAIGLRWSQDNSILHKIGAQKSLAYGVTIEGVQQPSWQVSSDRLFALYRQSFWRSWLYYELEPQLVRDWTTGKDVKSLFVFRIEANFGN